MKDSLNQIYKILLLKNEVDDGEHLLKLILEIMENIKNSSVLGSLKKASIKTLTKLLSFPHVVNEVQKQPNFNSQIIAQTLMDAEFETIDHLEEEQMLLLIQKALIQAVSTLQMTEESQFKVFKYFTKVIKKKYLIDEDLIYSSQFADSTKKNLHKIIYHFMGEDEEHQVKIRVLEYLFSKVKKIIQKIGQKKTNENKLREYACFSIKTIEDCFKKIQSLDELKSLIINVRQKLAEILCFTAESDDLIIRNQSQQAFSLILKIILDTQLPLREELEVLLVKIALKPAQKILKKVGIADSASQKSAVSSNKQSSSTAVSSNSKEDQKESDEEHVDFIRVNDERTIQDDLLLEMNINYLTETLLSMTPEQLAGLFLMYDCQPFSENFVTKSLVLIMRVAQQSPEKYCALFQLLVDRFQNFEGCNKVFEKVEQSGMFTINSMIESKQQIRRLAKDANTKYKNFLKKIEDIHAYANQLTPWEVASKILVYSREIEIDKVSEIIGGKDEKSKTLLNQYLDKMEFEIPEIELSLRKFLQTFRLAGVDSQVVFRILELFAHKYFDNDHTHMFANREESYEFTYLIIVLQTCQHNPNIKTKTGLPAFMENCRTVCPISKDTIPEEFFIKIYNSVTNNPFYAPLSKSLIEENYNIYNSNEIDIRLSKCSDKAAIISEQDFINSADLTKKQLFHHSNSIVVPQTLIPLASKHLISFLTHKFIKYNLQHSNLQQEATNSTIQTQNKTNLIKQKFEILEKLALLNKTFNQNEQVDRLFQIIYKVVQICPEDPKSGNTKEELFKRLENLVWANFDCLKKSLVLLPKLSLQSFLKEDIKDILKVAYNSVYRVYRFKHQEKRRLKEESKNGGAGSKQTQKQTSFFDLVYNYFTENNDEETQDEKNEKMELEAIDSISKRVLLEDKEGDYMDNIEEKFDEIARQYLSKSKSRLIELINLVCLCVKENINQEEGTLCLAFLEHLIKNSDQSAETIEKIWIELHLLVSSCLKIKQVEPEVLSRSSSQGEDKKSDYEVVSSDNSQDSIDVSSYTSSDLDIFVKEKDPIKLKVNESANKHLIMDLHFRISKKIRIQRSDNNHIIRDIQRIINSVIEFELVNKNNEHTQLFDEISFFRSLNNFITDFPDIGSYSKQYSSQFFKQFRLSKFLRLILLLLLRSTAKKLNDDDKHLELMALRQQLFSNVSDYMAQYSSKLPYDQISLSLEIFQKLSLPSTPSEHQERILDYSIQVIENLSLALQRQILVSDEAKQELWFKMIQLVQEKILFNNSLKNYEILSIQCLSCLKNLSLSHPFAIERSNFKLVKKLFIELLFFETFDNVCARGMINQSNSNSPIKDKEESKGSAARKLEVQEAIPENGQDADLIQNLGSVCINNLSDIFIYYISMLLQESDIIHTKDQHRSSENFEQVLFSLLWLNLLRVLLQYGEKSSTRNYDALIHSVHDNIKRIIEFLIQQRVLRENSQNPDMVNLWNQSWDIVSAFFVDIKAQVLGIEQRK